MANMSNILAFFDEPEKASKCLAEIRRIASKGVKAYTVAQHEYTREKDEIQFKKDDRVRTATKLGAVAGIAVGVLVALGFSQGLFKSVPASIIILLIAFAASGSLAGFLVVNHKLDEKERISEEGKRGQLILIVECPEEEIEKITAVIENFSPAKLSTY
ncbi:MAG: hypothetical protein GT589_01555 [Peptoclostridium sp.]|uniref:hypothetical protein n=1 Tax=Peptoclostridium sp. TaxID=1904860 RepID=UPI00139EA4F5|nr:hypothetical protein [Peptoclostridium sp.]MZQ74826.1 hypothetical protein [Peptoclostridium sp.]